jgi:hypothetical protein
MPAPEYLAQRRIRIPYTISSYGTPLTFLNEANDLKTIIPQSTWSTLVEKAFEIFPEPMTIEYYKGTGCKFCKMKKLL